MNAAVLPKIDVTFAVRIRAIAWPTPAYARQQGDGYIHQCEAFEAWLGAAAAAAGGDAQALHAALRREAAGERQTVAVAVIHLPTISAARRQDRASLQVLYSRLCVLAGCMDMAGCGGTDDWWRISDLADQVADILGLED